MRAALTVVVAIALAGPAQADPRGGRLLSIPTAWLPPAGAIAATLGLDHRGAATAAIGFGLGAIGELELAADSDVRACRDCPAQPERPATLVLGRAAFRIGAPQDRWFAGMPALVLGVRATFAARGHAFHAPRASEAYAVASRDLGAVRVHAGLAAHAGAVDGRRGAAQLRPLAGLEIHPGRYPRSSLLGDLAWLPTLDAARGPAVGWILGVGVRYQAFAWAAVELAVRAREGEGLGASTVMVRVHAVLAR